MSEGSDCPQTWALDEDGNKIPGTGRRCIRAEQCESTDLGGQECIGVKGHGAFHWRYDQHGNYCWWRDDCENDHDIASGMCPDGHPHYERPLTRRDETCLAHTRWESIED